MRVLEVSGLTLEHTVRVSHGVTGRPIAPLDAAWVAAPPIGRLLRVVGSTVLVVADERLRAGAAPPASPPRVRIAVGDRVLALRLTEPATEVALTGPELSVTFDPAPMTFAVDLVRPGGGASTGKTVEARASNATRVPLPEVADAPGTYRSAARTWTAGFNPLDLLVGNTLVRKVALDFLRAETRVSVVDPT